MPADLSEDELVARAKESPKVQAHLNGGEIRKTIVVPRKLVNLVVRLDTGTKPSHTRDGFVRHASTTCPTSRSAARQLLAGAVVALVLLLLAGRLLLRPGGVCAGPSRAGGAGEHGRTRCAAAAKAVVVDVVGAVRRPGLYRLAEGARVADALDARRRRDAAGAARPRQPRGADRGRRAGRRAARAARRLAAASGAGAATGAPSGPVHLNTATLEQLDALPGVGPVTAQKIVDYRQEHGAFGSVDELDAISGIGPARLEQLRDLVAP